MITLGIFAGENSFVWILDLILLITVIFTIAVVILENKDPIKTIAWILVLIVLPIVGIVLYLYFGRNYRKQKFISRKEISDSFQIDQLIKNQLLKLNDNKFIKQEELTSKRNIMRLLLNNGKAIITERNDVKILNDGKETFDAILSELENARVSINMDYYIIADDVIGNTIKDILIKKAQQGVLVKVIYDDVGGWGLSNKFKNSLKEAGVEIYSFLPVYSYIFANKINYRNHRKIIVVDGKVGFVGGLNIADRYLVTGKGGWRDIHLRIEGEAARSLQTIFITDWAFVSGQQLDYDIYFPDSYPNKKQLIQIASSGPDSDYQSIMQAYFKAISSAREYVYIATPYFLPNESIMTALKTAALGGVDVRIILPAKPDSKLVDLASRSYIEEVMLAGVKVYFYLDGFSHSKLLIMDDVFASVGTANMDIRSFAQNFEVNAIIYNKDLTSQLKEGFHKDLSKSSLKTYEEYSDRPLMSIILESIARLFSPLL